MKIELTQNQFNDLNEILIYLLNSEIDNFHEFLETEMSKQNIIHIYSLTENIYKLINRGLK